MLYRAVEKQNAPGVCTSWTPFDCCLILIQTFIQEQHHPCICRTSTHAMKTHINSYFSSNAFKPLVPPLRTSHSVCLRSSSKGTNICMAVEEHHSRRRGWKERQGWTEEEAIFAAGPGVSRRRQQCPEELHAPQKVHHSSAVLYLVILFTCFTTAR